VSDGDEIPSTHHVVRYCSSTRLREDGTPAATAFLPDTSEDYLSVFWLEFSGLEDREARVADIRSRMTKSGIGLKAKGKLAQLLVGKTKKEVAATFGRDLSILSKPFVDEAFVDDAHAGIFGISSQDLSIATFIASDLVEALHPARAPATSSR